MVTSYQAGYYTGRWFIRILKGYFATKVIKVFYSKAITVANDHKIDSKNESVVSDNLFECLQYID
jgi:hypothetical protein